MKRICDRCKRPMLDHRLSSPASFVCDSKYSYRMEIADAYKRYMHEARSRIAKIQKEVSKSLWNIRRWGPNDR